MSRLLVVVSASLLLSLASCLPMRHSGPPRSGPAHHQHYGQRQPCNNTCVSWQHRERCDRYGRCRHERLCVDYACR